MDIREKLLPRYAWAQMSAISGHAVSRNGRRRFSSSSMVNCKYGFIELRWLWNSFTWVFFRQEWLSSTYLNHHRGGCGAVEIAVSSTCSITMSAIVALMGDPIAQPEICW